MRRVAVLVPWRGGEALRERNWDIARPHLQRLHYPIYLGDKPGPWRRAAAINAAAEAAGDWEIALVHDADTIGDPVAIRAAVRHVVSTRGGARPHDSLWRLTRQGSGVVASCGTQAFAPHLATGTFRGGGLLVVHRAGWDAVGGFDESFIGWGCEDSAFNIGLLVNADWDRMPGNAWHLFHPPANQRTPECKRNQARLQRLYMTYNRRIAQAHRDKNWGKARIL